MSAADLPNVRDVRLLGDVIDVEAALQRLGGNARLFDELVAIALEDAPALLRAGRQALSQANAAEVRRAAHSLKGLMATIGATEAANAAVRVEHAAAAGDLAAAGESILPCGEHVAEVCRALQTYVAGGGRK